MPCLLLPTYPAVIRSEQYLIRSEAVAEPSGARYVNGTSRYEGGGRGWGEDKEPRSREGVLGLTHRPARHRAAALTLAVG